MSKTVGERIKRFRLDREMTQTELGEVLGVTKGAIQKYESGQIKNLKAETVENLSLFFGVPPAYFLLDKVPEYGVDDAMELMSIHFGEWVLSFIETLMELNSEGKRKLMDYGDDLRAIPAYRDDN